MASTAAGETVVAIGTASPTGRSPARARVGVPSCIGGKGKLAAVVILVIVVISASGSVSLSSSMTTSHRQCGARSDGTRGGRWTWRMWALGLMAWAVTSKVPSSMWWHMLVTILSPQGSASIRAPQ